MSIRNFARIFGGLFLLVGLAGFVPGLVHAHDYPDVSINALEGELFGLFPVNLLHSLVHAGFGVWGLVASRGAAASLLFARAVALIYAALTLMGFVPTLDVAFGLTPLFGNDIWLHTLLALIAAYFGWVHRFGPGRAA